MRLLAHSACRAQPYVKAIEQHGQMTQEPFDIERAYRVACRAGSTAARPAPCSGSPLQAQSTRLAWARGARRSASTVARLVAIAIAIVVAGSRPGQSR